MIASKLNDHFIARKGGKAFAYPIYDWGSADVWRLVRDEGYDYNRTYDVMNRTQLFNDLLHQRVCPPFGEEPLRGLWKYAECWPELWQKMLYRVPGAATAWRYANTELYTSNAKPDGMTWEQYTELQLANYSEPEIQAGVRTRVKATIAEHRMKTNDPIPEVASHPLSGCSWKFLSKIAVKGDFKNRTRLGMNLRGQVERKKTGMTYEEALKKFGTPGFQAAEKVKSDRPGIMAAR
jgi:predicted phosphoadenosine phosphosulfate sulfurtransferase